MLVQIVIEDAALRPARPFAGRARMLGLADIGDGDAVVFKIESHNHPPSSSPTRVQQPGSAVPGDRIHDGARVPIAISPICCDLATPAIRRPGIRRRRGRRDRRLRQLRRRADGRRRMPVPSELQRQHPGQRDASASPAPTASSIRPSASEPGHLCQCQDRARRHPRRDDGLGRIRRGRRREAPDGAGRRPVHRKASDRGVPRTDGRRCHRRDPGYGRGRAHLVGGRDGGQRRGLASFPPSTSCRCAKRA